MAVWLRRQEIDILKTRLVAQGLSDIASGVGVQSTVGKNFEEIIHTVFPFAKTSKKDTDATMVVALKKEVAKGALTFATSTTDVLKKKVKSMRVPDDFSVKMQQARMKGHL